MGIGRLRSGPFWCSDLKKWTLPGSPRRVGNKRPVAVIRQAPNLTPMKSSPCHVLVPMIASAAFAVASCSDSSNISDERPRLCKVDRFCAVIAPRPEFLEISKSKAAIHAKILPLMVEDFGTARPLFKVGRDMGGWTDKLGRRHEARQLFFVANAGQSAKGSLWVVFDHIACEKPTSQVLERNLDRNMSLIVVDGRSSGKSFMPLRIAVLGQETRVGPTFVATNEQGTYSRHEWNSDYVRRDWEAMVTSSCGGGPLTHVPRAWEIDRDRRCFRYR
jgi:hypothetical protein